MVPSCSQNSTENSDLRIDEVGKSFPKSRQGNKSKNNKKKDPLTEAVDTLKIVHSSMASNEFMVFAQSVGMHLSKLPLHKALQVQGEIQSLLTRARLSELPSTTPITPPTTESLYTCRTPSPPPVLSSFTIPSPTALPLSKPFSVGSKRIENSSNASVDNNAERTRKTKSLKYGTLGTFFANWNSP